ncbi:MAG: ATP-binding cassette domain-containing protein [Actinomycetota bacterium]
MSGDRRLRLGLGIVAFFVAVHLLWPLKPGIIVQGVVIGGLTALIAFGISLTYRANRIVNFAQGDLGAAPAVLAVLLIVGPRWPFPLATLTGLAAAVALGVLVEVAVIRRFTKAPRLILTVATIGLAQVLAGLGIVLPRLFDLTVPPQSYPAPFDVSFTIDPITFSGSDVLAMLVVPLVIVGLGGLLRYTDFGIAVRASAESADRASLLGIPVARVRVGVWVLATVLATIAMLLRAGIIGLPIGSVLGPAILLRALAAAVIGRMEKLPTIFGASVALGILEAAIAFRSESILISPITFVVLLGALVFQHRDRITRFAEASSWRVAAEVRRVPRELAGLRELKVARFVLGALLLAGVLVVPAIFDDGNTNKAALVLIFGIVAISLVVLTGWAGQVSLGQIGFLGVGAAVGGAATANWGWDLSLALLVAGGAGALVSLVIGIPALRVRGLLLAVVTLAFALAVWSWGINRDFQSWLPTGRVPRTPLFGRIVVESETRYYFLCLAVFVGVLAMTHALRAGRTGRVLVATRENERAAQSFGVNATRAKLTAFAFSGFFAALAGGLFVHHQQSLGVSAFAPEESLRAFTMVVIGGLGSPAGALLGAVYIQAVEWARGVWPTSIQAFMSLLGTGVGLLVVLMVLPGGLGAVLYRIRDGFLRRVAKRHDIVVPSLVADVQPDAAVLSVGAGASSNGGSRPSARERVPSKAEPALLRVRDLEVSYDGVQVLFGVDLDVEAGGIVALLGTNGAGKSTVLKAISGIVEVGEGSVALEGDEIAGRQAHDIAALGVVQAPGGAGVFPSLTVGENLRASSWLFRRSRKEVTEATERVLDLFPEIRDRLDAPAGNLSGGEQQMLMLAMAFIGRPKLLMIDELSLGLAPVLVGRLLEVVRKIRETGTTIVLVEQSVNVALTVADRAYFLEKGEVRFEGSTADLLDRPDVLRSVFLEGAASRGGGARRRAFVTRRARSLRTGRALEIREVRRSFGGVVAVDDLSLYVAPGEIVGVIGPNGAGKTTLFDLASGYLPVERGAVFLHGRPVTELGPDARARLGLGRSFQDARLFPGLTVSEAIAVGMDRAVDVRDPLAIALGVSDAGASERLTVDRVDELIELMGLGAFRDKFLAELSTGSRRIVDLACVLGHAPSVILFDEPSSGIAQREAEALGPLLKRVRDDTGAALLVIEHDMPLVTSIADRLIALDLGRVVTEGDPAQVVRHPDVVASYLGVDRSAVNRSGASTRRVRKKTTRRVRAKAR